MSYELGVINCELRIVPISPSPHLPISPLPVPFLFKKHQDLYCIYVEYKLG